MRRNQRNTQINQQVIVSSPRGYIVGGKPAWWLNNKKQQTMLN